MARPSPRPPEAAVVPAPAESDPAEEQFEECPDGLVVADASFRIIRMNRRFRELVDLPDEWASLDIPSRLGVLFAKLEDPAIGFRFVMRVQAAPLDVISEVFRLKDGKWFEVESRPLGDPAVGRRVVYYRDVTAREAAQRALTASEEQYRRTFESLHDVYYETDRAGLIVLMSPSCLTHTGYSVEEMVGTPAGRLWAAAEELAALDATLRVTDQVTDFEAHLVRKDGSITVVSLNAEVVRGPDGRVIRCQGTLRDISNRKAAEEERDRLFTASVDLMAVTDQQGRFIRVNQAWQKATGYSMEELIGRSVWHFIAPEDRADALARVTGKADTVGDAEPRSRFRHKDGGYRWLSWHFSPPSQAGFMYSVARDVTDAILAQRRLEELVASTRRDSLALERQAEELKRLRAEAEYQASHDGLTGLINRRAWFDCLTGAPPDAIAVIDIDYFKHVNDAYGHPAGDVVIAEVASRLAAALPGATVARIGGEEFGVALNGGIAVLRDAISVASGAIRDSRILLPSGDSVRLTVSVGLAAWRSEDSAEASVARSYEAADAALYEAKRRGRDRLMVAALHAA